MQITDIDQFMKWMVECTFTQYHHMWPFSLLEISLKIVKSVV